MFVNKIALEEGVEKRRCAKMLTLVFQVTPSIYREHQENYPVSLPVAQKTGKQVFSHLFFLHCSLFFLSLFAVIFIPKQK